LFFQLTQYQLNDEKYESIDTVGQIEDTIFWNQTKPFSIPFLVSKWLWKKWSVVHSTGEKTKPTWKRILSSNWTVRCHSKLCSSCPWPCRSPPEERTSWSKFPGNRTRREIAHIVLDSSKRAYSLTCLWFGFPRCWSFVHPSSSKSKGWSGLIFLPTLFRISTVFQVWEISKGHTNSIETCLLRICNYKINVVWSKSVKSPTICLECLRALDNKNRKKFSNLLFTEKN
jgi:hypothetical protein